MPFLIILGFVTGFFVTSADLPLCTDKITHNCVVSQPPMFPTSGSGGG